MGTPSQKRVVVHGTAADCCWAREVTGDPMEGICAPEATKLDGQS